MRGLGRKLRQTFGISAPRMAVRTHLSWRWKIPALLGLLLLIVGMWWWGFDFGQFLGGFDRGQVAERQGKLESEVAQFKDENVKLRARAAQLESDLNITRGAQATLSKQSLELQGENTQIKEELAFLQKLFSDTGKQGTISIQRLSAERERDDAYHYSLLVVRGGNPSGEFAGQLTLQAGLLSGGRLATVALPDDQPDASATLTLKFKYYQRIEGTIRVPPGSQLKTLQARVLELGQTSPRATRSLNISSEAPMFERRKSRPPQKRIDSLIGAGTVVQGNVMFAGGLRIDGAVDGKVATADNAQGTLVISEHARIDGEVKVSHVVINGSVSGPVTANDYLELQAKARVNGDVVYRTLEMHVGAIVQGKLMHAEPETASIVELKRARGE